jgi:hypothetical protein
MLVLFGVYPIPCLLLTWQGEEADGLGTTPNLLSFSTLLKGKQQERECIDVYLYDYYRPTRLGTISCSEKHKEHEALFNPAVWKSNRRSIESHIVVTVGVLLTCASRWS